jgi:hypothetical protein
MVLRVLAGQEKSLAGGPLRGFVFCGVRYMYGGPTLRGGIMGPVNGYPPALPPLPSGVGFGPRSFLCEVARRLQRSPMEAPILPEPDFLHVRAWRASHSSRHRIELTFAQ